MAKQKEKKKKKKEKKKRKKNVSKQQINLHMSIYKTHDLLNNSRTRICSSKTKKNKVINKILLVFLYLDTTHL